MKSINRIIAVTLAVTLIFTCGCFSAFAADNTAMLVLSDYNVRQGDEFSTTISLAENSNIYDFSVKLEYDTDLVTLLSAEVNPAAGSVVANTETAGEIYINFSSASQNITRVLDIVDLTFKVDDNIGIGTYTLLKEDTSFSKTASTLMENTLVDAELECNFKSFQIFEVGDVDLNSSVEVRDASIIRRYLAELPVEPALTEFNLRIADAEADGDINMRDPSRIQRHVARFTDDIYGDRINVFFYDDNGLRCATKSIVYDGSLTELPTISQNGTQAQWSSSATEYIAPNLEGLKKDISLYAFFEKDPEVKDEYNIDYQIFNNNSYLENAFLNGNIENPNPVKYAKQDGLVLQDLVVSGYDFLGWYATQSGGSPITEIPAGTTGNKVLYARWAPVNYTVQFDSPLASVDEITYNVEKGATLTDPSWFGYTFVGWSDSVGNIVTRIPVGTTGNITLHANWTSKRNQTVPVSSLSEPIIHEDSENGQYLFAYEIGRIENVPLYTIKDFGNRSGITITETTSTSGSIGVTSAETVSKMISKATTKSDSWYLSEEWNESTEISQEHANEVANEVVSNSVDTFDNTGKWSISSGNGGTKSVTKENGTSAKISSNLEAGVSAGPYKVNASIGAEAGVTSNDSSTNARSWNVNSGYEGSSTASHSTNTSSALSSKISDKTGYSQTKGHNTLNSSTSALAVSDTESREYASSLAYASETTETSVKEYTNANAPEGYYRLVCAGTVHVFAVVGYDIASNSYFTYTYNILDDEVKDFVDYSKSTSNFDDYENGVLPFDIPYEVNEYVNNAINASAGLVVDINTGKIVRYDGEATNVFVPEYFPVSNGDGTTTVVKITGFETNVFKGKTNIESVSFAKYVTEIPDSAFEGCTSLERVNCPSLKKIGSNAFKGCVNLESYLVSSNVTEMGTNAFSGVEKVTVDSANTSVAEAGVYSGANQIIVKLTSLSDTLENKTFTISDSTKYFELIGASQTYNGLKIVSDAETTVINGVNFANTDGVPLKLSSPKVTLNRISVSADEIALILSADNVSVSLYGTVAVNSKGSNAMICKNITLLQANPSAVGTLNADGNLLVCGEVVGEDFITFTSGEIVHINQASFDQMLQNSLEWVPESEMPVGGQIVAEKWTYDLITNITSDLPQVEGYTLYNTTSAWGPYGPWSSWQDTAVTKTESRNVKTQQAIKTKEYTKYTYGRWYHASNGTYSALPYLNGVKGSFEKKELTSSIPLLASHDGWAEYKNSTYGLWFIVTGFGSDNYGGTSTVAATYKTQYSYCDRSLIYTYYHTKTDAMESTTEVSPSETITNVKKWVQYVAAK